MITKITLCANVLLNILDYLHESKARNKALFLANEGDPSIGLYGVTEHSILYSCSNGEVGADIKDNGLLLETAVTPALLRLRPLLKSAGYSCAKFDISSIQKSDGPEISVAVTCNNTTTQIAQLASCYKFDYIKKVATDVIEPLKKDVPMYLNFGIFPRFILKALNKYNKRPWAFYTSSTKARVIGEYNSYPYSLTFMGCQAP